MFAKNRFIRLILVSLCGFSILLFFNSSCGSRQVTEAEKEADDSLAVIDTATKQPQLAVPPPTAEVHTILINQKTRSPFKDTGCCSDDQRAAKENCCCNELLEAYKKMRQTAPPEEIGRLKQEDPFLSTCRKKMKKEFEAVDNPPKSVSDKKERSSTDDLF